MQSRKTRESRSYRGRQKATALPSATGRKPTPECKRKGGHPMSDNRRKGRENEEALEGAPTNHARAQRIKEQQACKREH